MLSPSAFAQQKGDVLQVDTAAFHARSSAYFAGDTNISFYLAKDDIAEIISVRRLPSGNKALEIKVITGPNSGKTAWVYFDKKDPGLEVFIQMSASKSDDKTATQQTQKPIAVTQAPEEKTTPIMTEEEHLRFSKQSKAGNTAQDIEEYDRYLMSLIKDYGQKVEEQNAPELTEVVEDIIAFKPPTPTLETTEEESCSDCQDFTQNDPFSSTQFANCPRTADENRYIRSYNQSVKTFENKLNTQEFKTVLNCINAGMKTPMGGSGGFYSCPEADSFSKEAQKSMKAPCLSQSLVGSVASEIYMASRCFDQDYRKVLPLLVHESRFYPTIRSVTGAGGIGQLTGVAIKEINRNFNSYIEKYAQKPGCEYLKKVPKMNESYICARTYIPNNPRQNTVFSLIYQKMLRDNKKLNPKLVVDLWKGKRTAPLTANEAVQVEEMLLRTSYNSGPGSVLSAFKTYAASPSARDLPFNNFMSGFSSYLKRKVRAEAAYYNQKVLKDSSKMEEIAGMKCSI